MNVESLVEAISAAAGAAVVVGEASRRYWTRREARQQAEFRAAVQLIVDEALAPVIKRQLDVIRRQEAAERRQGQHLDHQDVAIAEVRRAIEKQS